jgi:HlyD family secretion protein
MRRWLIGILVAAAVIGLIVTAAGSPGQRLGFFSGFGSSSSEVTIYGNVDIRQVDLAFDVSGRIAEMRVEEGDAVQAGQVLAVLDADIYRHAVTLAEARRDAQRVALERLKAGSRPEEISRARADVSALKALRENALAVHNRRKSLVATGAVAQQAYDDARAALNEAEGKLKSAEETLALAIAGPRREDIEQAEAQLRAEEAALELARNRLDRTTLTAPGPGVVLTRVHEPGAVVLPNTAIYTVTLTDKVWVRTYAPEPMLGRIKPGMKVEVTTDGAPARAYQGWVGYISPTAEFTPKSVETPELRTQLVYRLRVHIADPDASLRQGMPVTIRWRDDAKAK